MQTATILNIGNKTAMRRQFNGQAQAKPLFQIKIRWTHCYACKTKLNSRDFEKCPACGWIMCECGACGCHFNNA